MGAQRRSLCREAVVALRRASGEAAGGSLPWAAGQRLGADADIIGGRRPWTVAMISSVSIPLSGHGRVATRDR